MSYLQPTGHNMNMVLPPFDPDDIIYVLNAATPTFDIPDSMSIPQLPSPSSSDKSSNSIGGINSSGSSSTNNQVTAVPTERKKKSSDGLVRKLCCLCENEKGHPNGFLVATDQIKRLPSNLSFMVSDKHLDYLKKQRQAKNICCDQCWETKIQPIIGEFPSDPSSSNVNLISNNYSEENDNRRKITSPKSKQKTPKKKKSVPLPPPEATSFDQVFDRSIPERKKFLSQHVHPVLLNDICKGNKEAYQTLLEDLSLSPHFLIQNYRLESLLKPVRNVNRKITKSHITRYILKKRNENGK